MYGNGLCSAQELAKGYIRLMHSGSYPSIVQKEILDAHGKLRASRKLGHVLRSKSVSDEIISVAETVKAFIKKEFEKRWKWLAPQVVLSYDKGKGNVTVPGKKGRYMEAAIKDKRIALPEDILPELFRKSPTKLLPALMNVLMNLAQKKNLHCKESEIIDVIAQDNRPVLNENTEEERLTLLPLVEYSIELYWPLDDGLSWNCFTNQ